MCLQLGTATINRSTVCLVPLHAFSYKSYSHFKSYSLLSFVATITHSTDTVEASFYCQQDLQLQPSHDDQGIKRGTDIDVTGSVREC